MPDLTEAMAAFMQRRKTVANALKALEPTAPAVLALAGIDGMRRPESLTLADFAHLTACFAQVKAAAPRTPPSALVP